MGGRAIDKIEHLIEMTKNIIENNPSTKVNDLDLNFNQSPCPIDVLRTSPKAKIVFPIPLIKEY